MRVVVKRLVVDSAAGRVPPDEHGVRGIHHDLPDVGVLEELGEWAVLGQIPVRPAGDACRVGERPRSPASSVVLVPLGHGFVDELTEPCAAVRRVDVKGLGRGPFLDGPLHLFER
jgi:hypothetical protein